MVLLHFPDYNEEFNSGGFNGALTYLDVRIQRLNYRPDYNIEENSIFGWILSQDTLARPDAKDAESKEAKLDQINMSPIT